MTSWTVKRIDDFGKVITGKTPSCEKPDEFGDKYPFITPSDIPETQRQITTERCLSEKGHESHKGILLPKKSVCVVCIGATIGKVCMTDKPSFSNQQINSIIPCKGKHDPCFVYYLSTTLKNALINFAGGSATPIINKSVFSGIKILAPDFKEQQKIAAVLSAYDDLIENNKRRIALLEKMAEEIYREWFVRMRFPGHEKVKIKKGLPDGWEIRPFSEVVEINPREKMDKSEEKPFVGMEDLSLNSMYFVHKEVRTGNAGSKFSNGDVLFPRITPSLENGKRGFVMTLEEKQVGLGSTEFIVMREKVIGPEHIYFLTNSAGFRKHAELSMVGASGRQRVHENCFTYFLLKTPPQDLRKSFSGTVAPIFVEIRLLSLQIKHLAETRGKLLPRLISGKLSIENLDIKLPPSMQDEATS